MIKILIQNLIWQHLIIVFICKQNIHLYLIWDEKSVYFQAKCEKSCEESSQDITRWADICYKQDHAGSKTPASFKQDTG